MTNKVDIFMPLYIKDYLAATSRLTTEQHGCYLLLIMDYWMNGALPDDDQALAQIVRMPVEKWSKHRASIERLFKVAGGEWNHSRIDKELETAKGRRQKARERGRLGAEARWKANPDENKHGLSNGASIDQASSKQWNKDSTAPAPAHTPIPTSKAKIKSEGAANADPPQKKSKRGSRIPDDSPTQTDLEWSAENFPNVNARKEADKFADYWASVAGQRGVKLDWSAVWRNWIRKSTEFSNSAPTEDPREKLLREMKERRAKQNQGILQ